MTPEERAQAILDRAGSVLAKVDRAHIFSVNECRQFPTFESTEIDLGPPLGKGGFSNVSEIFEFHLTGAAPESDKNEQAISERDSSAQKYLNRNKKITGDDDHDKKMHNIHYDVKSARDFMSEHASRFGSARYAIKQLRDDLDAVDRARGALDLAIEIKYLSAIWHPNISEYFPMGLGCRLRCIFALNHSMAQGRQVFLIADIVLLTDRFSCKFLILAKKSK